MQEYELPTNNGVAQFRWNFVHKRVEANLGGRFQSAYVSRGPWKLLFLYEKELGFTFSIMAEKNLAKLQQHLPLGIHYLEALISKNTGYDVIEGQMRIEGTETHRDPTAIEQLRDKLLKDFSGIIKNHVLILFDYNFREVVSARAVLLTPHFEFAYTDDWSGFIKKTYIIDKEAIIKETAFDDDTGPLVKLKPEKLERHADNDLVVMPEAPDAANK